MIILELNLFPELIFSQSRKGISIKFVFKIKTRYLPTLFSEVTGNTYIISFHLFGLTNKVRRDHSESKNVHQCYTNWLLVFQFSRSASSFYSISMV